MKSQEYREKQRKGTNQRWKKWHENSDKLEAWLEKHRAIKNEEIPEILNQLENGKSKMQLAKELEITRATLCLNLKYRGIPRNPPPPRYEPILKPTYELGYVLGVIYGDGCCYALKGTNTHVISLNARDKEFVEYFGIMLCRVLRRKKSIPIYQFQPKAKNRKPQYKTSRRSKKLGLFIKSLNIERLEQIVTATGECKIGFLRGFFDSDGSISLYKCNPRDRKTPKWLSVNLSNTNKPLLEMVKRLLASIEVKTFRITQMKMTNRWNKKPLYTLSFSTSKKNLSLFIDEVGVRIKRKQKNIKQWKTNILPLMPIIEQERRRKQHLTWQHKRLQNVKSTS